MATAATIIFNQYFLDDGTPANAATIDAYAAGTLNRKDLWPDINETPGTELSNPLTCAASGRVTFFLEEGVYDFVIKDSLGNTLDTKDGIVGSSGSGSSSLQSVASVAEMRAVPSGSSGYIDLGGYYENGDNRLRTFYWKGDNNNTTNPDNGGTVIVPSSGPSLGAWLDTNIGALSVKDFGARGRGVLEDGDEAKMVLCLALGRDVLIPEGDYLLEDELPLTNDNQIIRGEGYTTILQPTVNEKNGFIGTSRSNVQIRNLAIVFDVNSQTTVPGHGIELITSYNCRIDRVKIEKSGSFAIDFDGVLAGQTEMSHIVNDCYILEAGQYGINIESDTASDLGRCTITDNYIKDSGELNDSTGRGINIATNDNLVQGNTIDGATEYGLRLFSSAALPSCNDNRIIENTIRNVGVGTGKASNFSIYIYAESTGVTKNSIIQNNTIEDVGTTSVNDIGITTVGDSSIITGNTIKGTQGIGVSLATGADGYNIVSDNHISGITKGITSSYNVTFGNHFRDIIEDNYISVTSLGILASNCPQPVITKNTMIISLTTAGIFGIQTSGVLNETITNNYVSGAYNGFEYGTSSRGFTDNNIFTGYGNVAINGDPQTISTNNLRLIDSTLDTVDSFDGIHNSHVKTAGVTTEADDIRGIFNEVELDHNGSVIGDLRGITNDVTLTDGTIGDGQEDLIGIWSTIKMDGGVAGDDVFGHVVIVDLNGGTVTDDIIGLVINVDVEAAMVSVGGDIFGIKLTIDDDEGAVGTVYGFFLDDLTGVTYGFYQNGTAPNNFNGPILQPNMKSGASQGAAGAVAGELFKTAGHATLPDNVVMIGV